MIINYGELEQGILAIEAALEDYDIEEKSLILSKVRGRIAKKLQDVNVKNAIEGHPMMKLAKKFTGDKL